MRVIAESRIRMYCRQYPDAEVSLLAFLRIVRKIAWRDLVDLRKTYRHADAVEVGSGRIVTVINIKGNTYRLIVAVHYNMRRLYVLRFMPHAEYSRGVWKDSL